jgi:hypothetical protein
MATQASRNPLPAGFVVLGADGARRREIATWSIDQPPDIDWADAAERPHRQPGGDAGGPPPRSAPRQPIILPGVSQSRLYGPPSPDDAEDFEIREEELAGTYLGQALDALNDAGDPRRLYPDEAFLPERTIAHEALARYLGSTARVDASRTSVLFSALACEAYANRFIALSFGKRDREALDRLPTPDKLLIAPRLASGSALFSVGTEPLQSILRLFQLRNLLVHPKARKVRVQKGTMRAGHEDYTPATAARYVVAVATVARELDRTREAELVDRAAQTLWRERERLLQLGDRLTAALPDLSDKRPPGLQQLMIRNTEERMSGSSA